MISSITGIASSAVSFHLDRNQDKGASSLDDEEFAKGLGNHPRRSKTDGSKEKKKVEDQNELTPEEKQQVKELQKRDAEVRTHEMAHLASAGNLARGGPHYEYQTGPDGRSYAIGGHVEIDTSPGRTPEETIAKAAQMRAAAIAPAEPSPQDMKVASAAARLAAEAQQKISEKSRDDEGGSEEAASSKPIESSREDQRISFQFANELARFSDENDDETSSFDKDSDESPINRLIRQTYDSSKSDFSGERPSFSSIA